MGIKNKKELQKWHQELRSAAAVAKEKAEWAAANPAPSAWTSVARPSVSPSSESPSLLSADWPEEVESRESPLTSTRRPALSSDPSSRTSSVTPLSTPSTPRERPSLPSTLSTPSRDREEPSTASAAEHCCYKSSCSFNSSRTPAQLFANKI